MTIRRHAMNEKKKTDAKREFHCACATGDLSAIQPVVASPAHETTAKPVESKLSKPAAAVTPGAVGQQKTRG
jgi:hypothetical protein